MMANEIHSAGDTYRCLPGGQWERHDGHRWISVDWPRYGGIETMQRVNALWEASR